MAASPASADHPSVEPGLSEQRLRASEAELLGAEHAAEHSSQRRASRSNAGMGPLNIGPLSGETGSYAQRESLAAAAEADPRADSGAWGSPFGLPLFAIHSVLLPTGKVLWFGPPGNRFTTNTSAAMLWDPATGEQTRVDPPLLPDPSDGDKLKPANIYCSGQALLANGTVLVAGGTAGRGASPLGLDKIFTFNPFDETWTRQPDMPHGRWYPTQVLLPDGRQAIMSGLDETDGGRRNKTIEVFTPSPDPNGVGTLTTLVNDSGAPAVRGEAGMPPEGGLYPRMFAMPSGKTLVAGPERNDSWYLHTPGSDDRVAWSETPDPATTRTYGNSVLEPPAPGVTTPPPSSKVLQIGGGDANSDNNGAATTESFDEAEASPAWKPASPLNVARASQNTVLLPDGSMAAVGGGIGVGTKLTQSTAAHKQVELFDPVTRSWRLGAAQAETRAYHSSAVLLPDGRVVSAGDDANGKSISGSLDTAEVYEPPYLFKGPRPTITSAPGTAGWGETFGVSTPDDIDRAVLVAPGATTHADDMHQRYVPVELTSRPGGVDLEAPANANVAPPGYYMLFLVNSAGVPSMAKFIRIGSTPAPGLITIEKQTDPADTATPKTSFSFTGDAPLGSFFLADDETKASEVAPGTYQVTEGISSSHEVSSVDCDDGNSTGSVAARRATVQVSAGESVRCVFTNRRKTEGAGQALLIVKDAASLGAGDAAARSRLTGLGYTVVVRSESAEASEAAGKDVVLISATVASGAVNTKFRDSAVPAVVWEYALFDDMGMTQNTFDTHFGTLAGQRSLRVLDPEHPLAAGLSGTPIVAGSAQSFAWGQPGPAAANVAALTTDSTRSGVFGYSAGAAMYGLDAPARRVGLFLTETTADVLTADGAKIFDAAVRWAANWAPPPPPPPPPPPSESGQAPVIVENPTSPGAVPAPGQGSSALVSVRRKQRIRAVLRRGIPVSCRASRAGWCRVAASVGKRQVAAGSRRLRAGRGVVVAVRLNSRGRRLAREALLARKRVAVRLRVRLPGAPPQLRRVTFVP